MPKNIFLTGVTGFLGAHILAELLNKFADTKIYCLIRNKPNKTNEKRLKEILHFYFGVKYDLLINDRIIVVSGDLSRENMGIDITEYKSLTASILFHFTFNAMGLVINMIPESMEFVLWILLAVSVVGLVYGVKLMKKVVVAVETPMEETLEEIQEEICE